MTDVSALSVSIEVDMSAFMEAMEEVTAMLIATAEMFEEVARDISKALSGISESGGETQSTLEKIIKFIIEAVDIFKTLKEIINGVIDVFKFLGLAEEDATATTILASFLEFMGVAAELATPIGWVMLGLTSIALAYLALHDSGGKANEALSDTNDNVKVTGDSIENATGKVIEFNNALNDTNNIQLSAKEPPPGAAIHAKVNDNNVPVDNGTIYFNQQQGIINQGSQPGLTQGSSLSSGSNTNPDSSESDKPMQNIAEKFKQDYQNALDTLHQVAPPDKAVIKVDASASSVNINDSDLNNQSGAVNNLSDSYSQLGKSIKGVNSDLSEQKQKSDDATNSMKAQIDVSGTVESAIDNMVDALAKIGQKSVNPMQTLVSTITNGMKSFGKQMIAIGIGKQLMISLGTVAPPLLIAGGIALELAADVAMNSLKMASGGIVSGSTFANIGEYAGASHNPEVVAPLDKLQNMIGGGNVHHMEATVKGDDLVFVTSRVTRFNQNSTGGALGNY